MLTACALAFFLLLTPLEAKLQSIAASFRGEVAIVAKNLKTGETAAIDADKRVRTASVIKLPILVEVMHQVREGKLRLDQRVSAQPPENRISGSGILSQLSPGLEITLEDALRLMIDLSDNSATNVVLDLVTPEAVSKRMAALGLPNTKSLNKISRPLPNPTEENRRYGIGMTTPAEMVKLLEMIEGRELVDAESCEKMLAILKKQFYLDGIPRYLAGQKVEIALKTGALNDLRNDVGIVYTTAGPIAMAIFCDRSADQKWTADNEAELTIGKLARAVYDEWAGPESGRDARGPNPDGVPVRVAGETPALQQRPGSSAAGETPALQQRPGSGAAGETPALQRMAATTGAAYDVVISHAHIIDGSGNPWFPGDVAIKDGKVARIARYGSLEASTAKRFIDARNQIVSPGFTDVHTHSEDGLVRQPTSNNFIMDGVTSLVTGNCGGSRIDLGDYFAQLQKNGISLNVASLAGHNTIRSRVMGSVNRQATPEELEAMRKLVEKNMREGAIGFSTGLIYIPGAYANTEEVIELAKVAARTGGLYATHMRNEGNDEKGGVFEAISEALAVGERANMPVQISHFKVANTRLWGQSTRTLKMVEDARRKGQEVTVDQYPYRASSTGLSSMLPSWALADGSEAVKKRLSDPATRQKIAAEMLKAIAKVDGRKHIDYVVIARARFDPSIEGKNIAEINKQQKRKPTLKNEIETVLDLQRKAVEASSSISTVKFTMSDEDVERIMRAPFTMVASDGGIQEFNAGVPHPRSYGTRSRVLGYYVREKRNIGLEDAIRKMTSLPAQTFRLSGRGLLREGYWADVVIFDADKVADKATFQKPHQYAEGISYVLVNGEAVVAEGKHTGAKPGKIIYGPGKND